MNHQVKYWTKEWFQVTALAIGYSRYNICRFSTELRVIYNVGGKFSNLQIGKAKVSPS